MIKTPALSKIKPKFDRFKQMKPHDELHRKERACRCACCKRASKELNKTILDQIETENYHSKRMIEWIKNGANNSIISFTSGPQRDIAYAIEELLKTKAQQTNEAP